MSSKASSEKTTQIRILSRLEEPENLKDGITGSGFAETASEHFVNGDRVLRELIAAGLVERRLTPYHKTAKPYFITDAGREFLEKARLEATLPPTGGQEDLSAGESQRGNTRELPAAEQREVINRWQNTVSGMDGERITHLDKADDPVAHKLLEAAGDAIASGQVQAGIHILQLVVKDFHRSQEAALARQALDQIRKQAQQGR